MLALTRATWSFGVVLVLTEVAGGSIDTAMNPEASHRLMTSPKSLVRLHALFNTGALGGAAIAALVIHGGVSWRWVWPGIAVVALGVGVWALVTDPGTSLAPPDPGGSRHPSRNPLGRLHRDGLLALLMVFALAEITEGGVDTWGVLYLRNHLATGVLLGAGAYVVGQLVAATTHGAGGHLLGRLSTRRALITGAAWPAPASSSSRSRPSRASPPSGSHSAQAAPRCSGPRHEHGEPDGNPGGSAVGAFTAAGYVGWVAGAPLWAGSRRTWGLPAVCRSWPWPPSASPRAPCWDPGAGSPPRARGSLARSP